MKEFESLLKFLDALQRSIADKVVSCKTINDKAAYQKYKQELSECRRVLFREYFTFEDYLDTGKVECPDIKYESKNITYISKVVR